MCCRLSGEQQQQLCSSIGQAAEESGDVLGEVCLTVPHQVVVFQDHKTLIERLSQSNNLRRHVTCYACKYITNLLYSQAVCEHGLLRFQHLKKAAYKAHKANV